MLLDGSTTSHEGQRPSNARKRAGQLCTKASNNHASAKSTRQFFAGEAPARQLCSETSAC